MEYPIMRVLFITSRFPGDLRRGDQRRAYEQLRALSSRHAITLLTLDHAQAEMPRQRDLIARCEQVIRVPCPVAGMLARAVRALRSSLPMQTALYDVPALRQETIRLLAHTPYDIVHVQLARLGPLLELADDVPCVLDLIDALSLNMQRRALCDRAPVRWIARIEAKRLARYERQLCARARFAAISAQPDRAALGDPPNLHLVGNGVDLDEFPFAPHPRHGADIAFVGNLGYFPNIDAASWFARKVLPRVRAACPQAMLRLIGARPAPRLRWLCARTPSTELVGPVDSVHPYLARAAVAIAPLRAGSGQQLKILEAMATGTPVVASSIAAAGLDAVAGRDLLVADEAEAFADAIVRVLTDPALALRLARNARALIEPRYTWAASVAALEQLWLHAAGRESPAVTTAESGAAVRHADPLPAI
jgi:sugar transferase (PEP-CTERM/EpsH1 system associated)